MGRLTESMQGLRDAIKRQEYQLNSYRKNGGVAEIKLPYDKKPSEENRMVYQVSDGKGEPIFERDLHSAASLTSQASHWSCSLDTINTSIGDLKRVLKTQDKEVIRLIVENEELKNEIQKKEKELKKQKFLLKAEREMFEQYKKDNFHEVKKHKSQESQGINSDKPSKEVKKLKSELTHYKRLFMENNHTVERLSKQVSYLKDEKIQLREKLLQQEKASNKFILEMAQRFEVSRKEFYFVSSKRFESLTIPPTNLAVCKIAERNARLAYDNCMLKLELNTLKKHLFDKKLKENELQHLTTRSTPQNKTQYNDYDLLNLSAVKKRSTFKKVKASGSEKSSFTISSVRNVPCTVKTSVTSLIQRNSSGNLASAWQEVMGKKACAQEWDCVTTETVEIMRTESAPQLSVSNL